MNADAKSALLIFSPKQAVGHCRCIVCVCIPELWEFIEYTHIIRVSNTRSSYITHPSTRAQPAKAIAALNDDVVVNLCSCAPEHIADKIVITVVVQRSTHAEFM